jgi:hypothetical protein
MNLIDKTTYLAGPTALYRGVWMHWVTSAAPRIARRCYPSRTEKMRSVARSHSRLWKMLEPIHVSLLACKSTVRVGTDMCIGLEELPGGVQVSL